MRSKLTNYAEKIRYAGIVLLFVAIFRRISDYGLTENRYFVVLLALWILGISLYLLMIKKAKLMILPITIFILTLFSAIGPWGAIHVSKKSQVRQFEKILSDVKSHSNSATYDQYQQLKSIISYLDEREALAELNPLTGIAMVPAFKDSIDDEFKSYGWLDTEKIMDSLGITISAEELSQSKPNGEFYNYYGHQYGPYNYDIKEFHYLAPISFNSHGAIDYEIGEYNILFDAKEVTLSLINGTDSIKVLEIPLKEKLKGYTQYGPDLTQLNEDQLTILSKNDSILVKLIISDLGFNVKNVSITINHSNALLFLRQQ